MEQGAASAAAADAGPLVDLYLLLGVPRDADEQAVRKGYRRRALELHPDKNPDNPKAEALFMAVKAASEALLDRAQRAVLDARLAARDAAALRFGAADSRRARQRAELEQRERAAAAAAARAGAGARDLAGSIDRLRREGQARQAAFAEKQQAQAHAQARAQQRVDADEGEHKAGAEEAQEAEERCTVRLRWSAEAGERLADEGATISEARLRGMFRLYGAVAAVVARRARAACVVFETADAAEAAIAVPPDGFRVSRAVAGGKGEGEGEEAAGSAEARKRRRVGVDAEPETASPQAPPPPPPAPPMVAAAPQRPLAEREAVVLARMREAARRRTAT